MISPTSTDFSTKCSKLQRMNPKTKNFDWFYSAENVLKKIVRRRKKKFRVLLEIILEGKRRSSNRVHLRNGAERARTAPAHEDKLCPVPVVLPRRAPPK